MGSFPLAYASRLTFARLFMDGVDPAHGARLLHWFDIQIYDHGFVVAADEHALESFVARSVDFLMRDVGRHIDEVAGSGFSDVFEMIAPAHAGAAADDIDDAFERAVMMSAGLGVGEDIDGAGPDLLRSHARIVDGGGAIHAGRLSGVGVERILRNDFHPVRFPVDRLTHIESV